MTKIQKVIHIRSLKEMNSTNFSKYNRIYIGSDSCPNLLPKETELKEYFSIAKQNNLKVSLLTSFCFDAHIELFKQIIPILIENKEELELEIIINDWGIFNLIKDDSFALVLGRLLTKQKKGPRVENIIENLNQEQIEVFTQIHCEFFEEFLLENNFIRIELDNIPLGINYTGKIPASLYYPFVFVSPSSLCIFEGKVYDKAGTCSRKCINNSLILENEEFKNKLYRKGNSFFYKNKQLPQKQSNINRIVLFAKP